MLRKNMDSKITEAANAIVELARQEWERDKSSDFELLRSIPCSHVKAFLRLYESLQPSDANRLMDIRLASLPRYFIPKWEPCITPEDQQWHDNQMNRLASETWGWDCYQLSILKTMVTSVDKGLMPCEILEDIPKEKVEWIRSAVTAKAPQLRKALKALLKAEFNLTPKNDGGGVWKYTSPNPSDFSVIIDYGGSHAQFYLNIKMSGGFSPKLNYERLLGVPSIGWNWMLEENLDHDCALLTDLIKQTVNFSRNAIDLIKNAQPESPLDGLPAAQ